MRGYPPNSFFASNMVHPPIKQPRGLFIPDWHQRWNNKDEPRVIQDDIYRMYNGWFPAGGATKDQNPSRTKNILVIVQFI